MGWHASCIPTWGMGLACRGRSLADLNHAQVLQHWVSDALPCLISRHVGRRQACPLLLPRASNCRSVALGQPVNVCHLKAKALHRLQDRRRWRSACAQHLDGPLEATRGGGLAAVGSRIVTHRWLRTTA
eukprot:scaffold58992_cov32-Tisochrysis_lutea.AAC.2